MNTQELQAKLKALPDNPGCYLMKDVENKIIYVGKAKSLKNRVKQYFTGAHDFKTTKMVAHIQDFDYVLTNTEKEALLLEINLIKQHTPRFNIMFMDDKSYPYIKLTNEEYPMLRMVRERKRDKSSLYFGPYPDAGAARQMITLLNQLYPLRKCQRLPKKACLYYYLHECLGPCEFDLDKNVYEQLRNQVVRVLKGDTKELLDDLHDKMVQASQNLAYEKAKEYYDLIQAVNHVSDKQQVQTNTNIDQDYWNLHADKGYICIQQLVVRNGKLLRKKAALQELYEDEQEALLTYIAQYYLENPVVKEIIVPNDLDTDSLDDLIVSRIVKPFRGHRMSLLKMAYDNAVEYLNRKFSVINTIDEQNYQAQDDLNKLLKRPIERIEVFDNSHLSGSDAVAGMVVFVNGKASKKDYRKFQLHQQNNDVASMKEVIYRRYFRLLKDQLTMPDLILVDGGFQQVQAAQAIISALYLNIPVLGMVKDNRHNTAGLIQDDGTLCDIPKESALFFLITRIQDEVHRFAISYHQQKRLKSQTHSMLDDIKGIGTARKQQLLKHFGSFQKLKEATLEQLSEVVPLNAAEAVFEHLHGHETEIED
ncbi:MAG: excinuclease ABC subunit UvrC [Erysipelotrichaceae bacterium]|nr:excinuclease ABC subunit UvrC [Erysipelotrichaceae bacterium]